MTVCSLCSADHLKRFEKRDAKTRVRLELATCQNCGLIQQINLPSDSELGLYYSHHYREDYKNSYEPRTKHIWRAGKIALERLLFLESHGPTNLSNKILIDVGAGGGEFVYLATKRGLNARGLEPNIGYSEFAHREYGVSIKTQSIESLAEGSADLVSMFHVLEHLPKPTWAVEKIFRALRDDGLLFLEVPNILQLDASPHNIFFRAHLFYFSLTTLASLTSPFFTLIASEVDGNLRLLFKKRPVISPMRLPSQDSVQKDLARYHQKSWWTYLTTGKGYRKLFSRPKRIFEELSIRSHRPRDLLDTLHMQTLSRRYTHG